MKARRQHGGKKNFWSLRGFLVACKNLWDMINIEKGRVMSHQKEIEKEEERFGECFIQKKKIRKCGLVESTQPWVRVILSKVLLEICLILNFFFLILEAVFSAWCQKKKFVL